MPTLFDTPLRDLDIAAFDLETTGLYPSSDHIIQMAVVPVDQLQIGPEESFLELKINPGDEVQIPHFILDLTGLSIDDIRNAPTLNTQLRVFDEHVGTRIVAGHNVRSFDLPFLRRAERRVGIDVQTDYYIDTFILARKLHPHLPGHKLSDCADHYGIDYDSDELHDALTDTRVCAEVLLGEVNDLAGHNVETFGDMIEFVS